MRPTAMPVIIPALMIIATVVVVPRVPIPVVIMSVIIIRVISGRIVIPAASVVATAVIAAPSITSVVPNSNASGKKKRKTKRNQAEIFHNSIYASFSFLLMG
jgi:hypothetical protein